MIKVSDFANIKKVRTMISNAFTEKGADMANALRAVLDELESMEVEMDEQALAEKVKEVIDAYMSDESAEVPAAVANAIANKMSELQKAMPVSDKMTPAIKNAVASAILRAHGKEEAKKAAEAVLVQNGISGLTFEAAIDYAVVNGWEDNESLVSKLKMQPLTKWFYTTQTMLDSGAIAHGWDKDSETAKEVQALTVNGKTISTQYIYKRQQAAFEDLDSMEEVGEANNFLNWINKELWQQINNTIAAKLLGQTVSDVTSIEPFTGASSATDAFRTAVTVTDADDVTFAEARAICDAVKNPHGKRKMAIMTTAQLTALSEFNYASGGTTLYRSKEEVAAQLGVDEIYVTDLATTFFCIIPDGYWLKEKKTLNVSYPTYEFNVMNYQRERNIGGGVHDLKSVAFGVESV